MIGWIRKLLGDRGERQAARFLRRQGYRILARQYASPFGEIDLIARDGEWIVFVEVKTRRSDVAGLPVEAVDPRKQRQITRAALAFLKRHGLLEHRSRFDIVGILWPDGSRRPRIDHYRHAFPGIE